MLKKLSNQKKKKKGFTLIELVIVMAILVVLAAVAIPNLTSVKTDAKKTADDTSKATIISTISTLVAADKIATPGNGKVKKLVFDGSAITEGTAGTGETLDALASGELKIVQDAFPNVPKTSSGGSFTATISDAGKVTVTQ